MKLAGREIQFASIITQITSNNDNFVLLLLRCEMRVSAGKIKQSTDKILKILRTLTDINIVGMDVVEVAPAYDNSEITALAAATIALELMHLWTVQNKQI